VIPLRDENPTRRVAIVTIGLIAACVGVYFFVQPVGQASVAPTDQRTQLLEDYKFNLENAAIPCEVVRGRPLSAREVEETVGGDATACTTQPASPALFPGKNVFLAVAYSMFLHGSLLHLAGNMLFLWVFGNNIEDKRGKVQYVLFYLAAGVAATATHIGLQPSSTVPLVGASGAIAGVMGAYLVLFPRVPIRTLIIFFFIMFRDIEARWLLGFWFASQFFINPNAGVAWAAHVGGFVFGVLVGLFWRPRRRPAPQWTY
jgi:membrane associated rhomboid family serine protease